MSRPPQTSPSTSRVTKRPLQQVVINHDVNESARKKTRHGSVFTPLQNQHNDQENMSYTELNDAHESLHSIYTNVQQECSTFLVELGRKASLGKNGRNCGCRLNKVLNNSGLPWSGFRKNLEKVAQTFQFASEKFIEVGNTMEANKGNFQLSKTGGPVESCDELCGVYEFVHGSNNGVMAGTERRPAFSQDHEELDERPTEPNPPAATSKQVSANLSSISPRIRARFRELGLSSDNEENSSPASAPTAINRPVDINGNNPHSMNSYGVVYSPISDVSSRPSSPETDSGCEDPQDNEQEERCKAAAAGKLQGLRIVNIDSLVEPQRLYRSFLGASDSKETAPSGVIGTVFGHSSRMSLDTCQQDQERVFKPPTSVPLMTDSRIFPENIFQNLKADDCNSEQPSVAYQWTIPVPLEAELPFVESLEEVSPCVATAAVQTEAGTSVPGEQQDTVPASLPPCHFTQQAAQPISCCQALPATQNSPRPTDLTMVLTVVQSILQVLQNGNILPAGQKLPPTGQTQPSTSSAAKNLHALPKKLPGNPQHSQPSQECGQVVPGATDERVIGAIKITRRI